MRRTANSLSSGTHTRPVNIVVCSWQNVWFSQLPLLRPGRHMPAWTMVRFTVNLSGPYLKRQAFSRSLCRFSGRLISQGANYMTESGPHDLRLPLTAFLNHCAILVVATSSAQILQYTFVLLCMHVRSPYQIGLGLGSRTRMIRLQLLRAISTLPSYGPT